MSGIPAQQAGAEKPVGLILGAVATVLLLASFGQTSVSTALPVIAADLGGLDHISWAITAYLLASTISAPVYGKLGDVFGRRVMLHVGIAVFLSASMVAALSQSMTMLIVARGLQGLGGGGLIVTAMAVVGDVMPARERGRAQGMLGGVFGVSTVLGPLVGGFLVEQLSWRWIFFVNLPLGLVAAAVLAAVLPRGMAPARHGALDYAGAGLLATGLAGLVLTANLGGHVLAWGSPGFLALVAATVGGLAGFALAERRAEDPILPLSLFRNNNFVLMNLTGLLVGSAMFGTITFLPTYLQIVQGVSPTVSGLFLLPMMLGIMAASLAAGQVMMRTGRYKALPVASCCLLAVGMALLATLTPATALWQVGVYAAIVGLGIGPVMSAGVTAIQNAVAPSMLGVATASANMFRLTGGSVGTAAFGAIFAAGLRDRLAEDVASGRLGDLRTLDAGLVAAMPPDLRARVLEAFSDVLHPIFAIAGVLALGAAASALALRELPLAAALPEAGDGGGGTPGAG